MTREEGEKPQPTRRGSVTRSRVHSEIIAAHTFRLALQQIEKSAVVVDCALVLRCFGHRVQ